MVYRVTRATARLAFCLALVSSQPIYSQSGLAQENKLTLSQAVSDAIAHDLWLTRNRHAQSAITAEGVAAGALPDPKISVGFANLPTDTFEFNQEAMTQFKVGVTQKFPRGESLALKQQQLMLTGEANPWLREDRKARTAASVTEVWLDGFQAQQSIHLIENDRALFEQLVEVAQVRYSSVTGQTRQQDIVHAQLELTRLDDRLAILRQQHDTAKQKLSEWLSPDVLTLSFSDTMPFSDTLPELAVPAAALMLKEHALMNYLAQHPAVKALEKKEGAAKVGIRLAEQAYKPEWAVNGSYGYRDDAPAGADRADFFSIGITLDMPLFTASRQDQQVKAAKSRAASLKTDKTLLIKKLASLVQIATAQLARLDERQHLYTTRLLPQTIEQAEGALVAYTSDEGEFADVMRARIAGLNANMDALTIRVEHQKVSARLNYLLMAALPPSERQSEGGVQ